MTATSTAPDRAEGVAEFVERCGMALESTGATRLSGRLLGWLLVCDPPQQSAEQLGRALRSSTGGISTAVRQLVAQGFVERTGIAGDRRVYYRLKPDAWAATLTERQSAMTTLREVADDGLLALDGEPARRRDRLASMRGLFAFLEDEFPTLVRRYQRQGATRSAEQTAEPTTGPTERGGTR